MTAFAFLSGRRPGLPREDGRAQALKGASLLSPPGTISATCLPSVNSFIFQTYRFYLLTHFIFGPAMWWLMGLQFPELGLNLGCSSENAES